jgi:hypothetical protein
MLPTLWRRNRVLFETPGGPGGGPPAPPAQPPPADPPDGLFDAIYVKQLRAENASFRVRAKEATAALTQVGELLGLDADAMADVQRVKHAASSLRLAADVEAAINRHGLDRKLTFAVLAQERALADVQPGQPDTGSRLDEVLTKLAKENPALTGGGRGPLPPRSGLPITGGGANQGAPITRAELAHLPPERVEVLRKAGLLDHILRGG